MMKVVICMLVLALVAAPNASGQCMTYILEHGPCTNGADSICCNILKEITSFWNPHVESIWCVCQALQYAGLPVTYLNDCGVVEGSDPYC
ncbi:hypothetical protein CASFOL_020531 [Castilleja foliolosa]|uniref:Bifunctional inhibitor/plant lipid transfer protein/seed storage helical domain-containing protein n=1 Tax=Castilleja foliolosa TaxID=1961234 RepID=A0ABD3D2F2_9LAMI